MAEFQDVPRDVAGGEDVESPRIDVNALNKDEKDALAKSRLADLVTSQEIPGKGSSLAPAFPYDFSEEAQQRRREFYETPPPAEDRSVRIASEIEKSQIPGDVRLQAPEGSDAGLAQAKAKAEAMARDIGLPLQQQTELLRSPVFISGDGTYRNFKGEAYGYKDKEKLIPKPGPELSLDAKYAILQQKDGVEYVLTNPDGSYALQDGNATTRTLFSEQRRLEQTTIPAEDAPGTRFLDFLGESVLSYKGPRNLGELDQRLAQLGVNKTGRAQFIDEISKGNLDIDMGKALKGPTVVLGLPLELANIVMKANLKTLALGLDGLDYLFGDGERTTGPGYAAAVLDNVGQYAGYNIPNMEQFLANRHDLDVRVVQHLMQPQGVEERVERYYPEYGGFHGMLGMYHGAKSRSLFAGFTDEIMKTYKGKNFGEAVENAWKQGKDYHTLKAEFIEQRIRDARFKGFWASIHERRMQTGLELASRDPVARKQMGIVTKEIDAIDKRAADLMEELKLYEKAGNKKKVFEIDNAIFKLEQQKSRILDDVITPAAFKNIQKELGIQTSLVAGTVEAYTQFFGNDPRATPFVEMATSLAISMRMFGEGLWNYTGGAAFKWGKGKSRGAYEWYANNPDFKNASTSEKLKMIDEADGLDKIVKQTMKDIANSPPEFQRLVYGGAEEAAGIRADLIRLSQMSGVKIDEDKFLNTLGDVANMAGLITLARTMDEKIIVTGLNQSLPYLLGREAQNNNKRLIVTQMADSLRELTRAITVADDVAGNHATALMIHNLLRKYVTNATETLARDELDIRRLLAVTPQQVEAIHYGSSDVRTGGLDSSNSIAQIFDFETRALKMGINPAVAEEYDLSPDQILIQRAQQLDQIAETRSQVIKNVGSSITPEMAATGEAGVHAAHTYVHINDYHYNKANQLYNDFEKSADGSFADISEWGFDILNNPQMFTEIIPDSRRGVRMTTFKEGQLSGTSKSAFNALLLDAAERSVQRTQNVMDSVAPGSYDEVITKFRQIDRIEDEVTLTALDEFKLMYKFSKTPEGQAILGEGGGMPLLITATEWKDIRQELSEAIGRFPDQKYYRRLKDAWDTVGDPESDTAFRYGWFSGQEPRVVADEVFTKFRNAQSYWKDNIVDRQTDAVGQFSRMLTEQRVKRLTNPDADRMTVVAEFSGYDIKDQPIYLLDKVLKQGIDTVKSRVNTGQPLTGVELQTLIEAPLAKLSGGFKDENGLWRIIVKDDLDPASKLGTYGREIQRATRLWLQGSILNTKSMKKHLDGDAQKAIKAGELKDNQTIQLFARTLEGIQVYQRNADGTITPYRNPGSQQSNVFVHAEEVNIVNDERFLESLNEEARKKIDQYKADFTEYKTSVAENASIKIEAFRNELNRDRSVARDLGLDVDKELGNFEKIGQMVYMNVVEGGMGIEGLPRLKRRIGTALQKTAPNANTQEIEELTDEFVARYTMEYIVKQSTAETGATIQVYSERFGRNFTAPEIGINVTKMAELIGGDTAQRQKLKEIINYDGMPRFEVLESVVKVAARVAAPNVPGVTARVPTISLDSLLSRGYNLNREVVSPQYTAIELILRQSRQSGARALNAMLNNPKLAIRILDEIQYGGFEMPDVTRPDFQRMMTVEILRQEAENEYIESLYGDQVLPGEPTIMSSEPAPVFDEFTFLEYGDVAEAAQPPAQIPRSTPEKIQPTGVEVVDQLRALGFKL